MLHDDFPVVLLVASLGGPRVLRQIIRSLPADFAAAVIVVQHRAELPGSAWGDILQRSAALPVMAITELTRIRPGTVYFTPAARHVEIIEHDRCRLTDGRRVRGVRSSANPLFESAARRYGPRVIAVVLTGYGRDGTDGVQAVRAAGGIVIAQDEASSEAASMPLSAIASGAVDYVVPLDRIGPLLTDLVRKRPVTAAP